LDAYFTISLLYIGHLELYGLLSNMMTMYIRIIDSYSKIR
jgi:hypothetical protein